eukprot:gene5979-9978_t
MESNNINLSLKEAFNLDSQKRFPEAYLKYITCINEINKLLIKPEISETVLKKLFSLSKQCTERAETIRFSDNFLPETPEEEIIQQSYSSQPNYFSGLLRERKQEYDAFEEKKKQLDYQNQQLKSKMTQNPNDLKSMRKYLENVAIKNLQDEIKDETIYEEIKKSKRQRYEETQNYLKNLKLDWKNFKWKRKDKWSDFIDENFSYHKMNINLLSNDQEWIKKLKTNFSNEEMENHLNAILNSKSHSLHLILILFITKFQQAYNQKSFFKFENEKDFLLHGIDDVQKDLKKKDDLFMSQLNEFIRQDDFINLKYFQLGFQLNYEKNHFLFEDITDNLKNFDFNEKIDQKIFFISNSIDKIFEILKKEISLKEYRISNEDVFKIFSFCLVKSKIEDPFSIVSMIEDFKMEENITQEEEYSLNMFKTSLNFILDFNFDDAKKLKFNFNPINPFDDF